jgi:hypothetical protein
MFKNSGFSPVDSKTRKGGISRRTFSKNYHMKMEQKEKKRQAGKVYNPWLSCKLEAGGHGTDQRRYECIDDIYDFGPSFDIEAVLGHKFHSSR